MHEETSDEREDAEDDGNHGLRKFSEEGFDLGFEFGDAVGLGRHDGFGRWFHESNGEQVLVRHVGVADDLAAIFADKFGAVFVSVPVFAVLVDNHVSVLG